MKNLIEAILVFEKELNLPYPSGRVEGEDEQESTFPFHQTRLEMSFNEGRDEVCPHHPIGPLERL